ncbi:protein MAIN-LIKE 1-like [Actinidia eriantha]|uniref:protein MAIN-LIKE 1-like n=1 Tax=Actinidia eriantha TaxID=165200 RepID=UPI002584F9A6|nr:protein MAIN-LIKE 1-like [Actinidia eriantha]
MSWLRRTFDVLPEHADDISVQRHARAYILRLIGGILFTDYSQTLVKVAYLPLLLDLDAAGACSWGSAVLAMLYRSMCRATKIGQRQIAGALLLLQIWACERFPHMCPYRVDDHTAGQQPLLIGGCISPVDHGELDGDLDFARPLLPPMSSEFTEISWTV